MLHTEIGHRMALSVQNEGNEEWYTFLHNTYCRKVAYENNSRNAALVISKESPIAELVVVLKLLDQRRSITRIRIHMTMHCAIENPVQEAHVRRVNPSHHDEPIGRYETSLIHWIVVQHHSGPALRNSLEVPEPDC